MKFKNNSSVLSYILISDQFVQMERKEEVELLNNLVQKKMTIASFKFNILLDKCILNISCSLLSRNDSRKSLLRASIKNFTNETRQSVFFSASSRLGFLQFIVFVLCWDFCPLTVVLSLGSYLFAEY